LLCGGTRRRPDIENFQKSIYAFAKPTTHHVSPERGDVAMQALPRLLTRTLDREWRLLDPERIKIEAPPIETPQDEALRPLRRPKIGRVD
jgi:hypothetical protein